MALTKAKLMELIDNGDIDVGGGGVAVPRMTVGYVYITFSDENPAEMYGGVWERLAAGTFLTAAGSGYVAGDTGGVASVTLTVEQMPRHNHLHNSLVGSAAAFGAQNSIYLQRAVGPGTEAASDAYHGAGKGRAHENRPPYIAVYMWRRTG